MTEGEIIKALLAGYGVAGGVIAFLFYRLEAARKQLYDDARADAATDKEVAEALALLAKRSKKTTSGDDQE